MTAFILTFGRFCEWQYAGLLRFGVAYLAATQAICSIGGNNRYLNHLSQERELLQGQLDRLEVGRG